MPSCLIAIRTLCRDHRRLQLRRSALRYLPLWKPDYSYCYRLTHNTSVAGSRKHDSFPKPASTKVMEDAESAYLDYLQAAGNETPLSDTRKDDPRQNARTPRGTGNRAEVDVGRARRSLVAHRDQIPQQRVQARHPRNVSIQRKREQQVGKGPAYRHTLLLSNHDVPSHSKKAHLRATAAGLRRLSAAAIHRKKTLGSQGTWLDNVTTLYRFFQPGKRAYNEEGNGKVKVPLPVLPPSTFDDVEQIYAALDEGADISRLFTNYAIRCRPVTLWFLHYDPATALDVVLASGRGLYFLQVRMALQCLVAQYQRRDDRATNLKRLVEALPTCERTHSSFKGLTCFNGTFYNFILDYLNDEAISRLYENLKRNGRTRKSSSTWLHFTSSFLDRHMVENALGALLHAKNAHTDIDSAFFSRLCSRLLRTANKMPGGLRTCIRIIDKLVGIGVTLNNHLTNIIMLNAVEAGDLKTAMEIYHSIRDHGLRPDDYTFAILLKACKSSIDDAELLNETIREALGGIDVLKAPVVATEILHCLALHHTKHHPGNTFEIVADAYAQLFTLEAPRLVGLLPSKLSHLENQDGLHRLHPRSRDIYILLATFLEQSFKKTGTVDQAYEIWQRFKNAIEAGREPFASMAKSDHVFNAFLCTFVETKRGLLHAAEVVKYMQAPDEADAKPHRTRPTVQTWSIFVHGFTRHGQMHLAEQLLTYMRGKGIRPNDVTWNTLLGGYANEQDLEGVIDTIRRLETAGHVWDEWTLGNLRRYRKSGEVEAELRRFEAERT